MKLYHWPSVDALANYGPGTVTVVAQGIDEARLVARAVLVAADRTRNEWRYKADGTPEEDESETVSRYLRTVEEDIAREPVEIEGPNGVWTRGSD